MNKNLKNKENHKKKLLVLMGISAFTVLGGTLAYFTTGDNIQNVFNSARYGAQIVENFQSPDNWTPGTTTKEITVKNTGSINMAVRASYEERWVNAKGTEISLKDSENHVASIINFNSDWQKNSDGYYYYGTKNNLTKLKPNTTSSSFISGVTFNQDIKADLTKTVSADGKTITYESTGNGYDGAKYYLTVKIETIQYDYASHVW